MRLLTENLLDDELRTLQQVNSDNTTISERVTNVLYESLVGGQEGDEQVINLGGNQGTIDLSYETYEIPDRLQLIYESKVIFDSGFEGTKGVKSVQIPFGGNAQQLTSILTANPDNPDTRWYYTVGAEIDPLASSTVSNPFIGNSNIDKHSVYEFLTKDVA